MVCKARLGRQGGQGKALLETTELIFRGDFRAKVPFKSITALAVKGPTLTVTWPEGTLALELGQDAATWAEKIRHPPSRLDKLGVKANSSVATVGKFEREFLDELGARAARIGGKPEGRVNLLFFAAQARADLERLGELQKMILPDGAIWVVRRKGNPAITERDVLGMGRAAGLVDTKVVAFSATHTGQKLVIPVARR